MVYGVLNDGLDDKGRHAQIAEIVNIRLETHALYAKTSLLKRKIAHRLLHLAIERDEVVGVLERLSIKRREFAQKDTGASWIGADERGDGVDGVEEEVRVDLRLKGLQLCLGCKLNLSIELCD